MRVLILQQAALPGQMLTPGVVVEVNDAAAAWLIESGAAQAVEAHVAATSSPAPVGAAAAPAARPRRKAAE